MAFVFWFLVLRISGILFWLTFYLLDLLQRLYARYYPKGAVARGVLDEGFFFRG